MFRTARFKLRLHPSVAATIEQTKRINRMGRRDWKTYRFSEHEETNSLGRPKFRDGACRFRLRKRWLAPSFVLTSERNCARDRRRILKGWDKKRDGEENEGISRIKTNFIYISPTSSTRSTHFTEPGSTTSTPISPRHVSSLLPIFPFLISLSKTIPMRILKTLISFFKSKKQQVLR